ncbi:mannosyl-oligosaccharide alpha-1 2-mannosidase [Diplogelasinospora grovesii]|uniref:alpha-1,2-Mannosidase n=1 Tax=Diplogelasinospora grovesii TaxID=303347 RepID=A0AAN6N732_9PEZI|nr:mannosyl-oligosaccharide alpha-1 2-mannosidase [Diplogelasinospora grovesii]
MQTQKLGTEYIDCYTFNGRHARNCVDPFNLQKRNGNISALAILRATATQAAAEIRERAVEVGAQALDKLDKLEQNRKEVFFDDHEDMSFTVPKNVPSFSNPQRQFEDRLWGSSGKTASKRSSAGNRGALQEAVQDFINPGRKGLPMYKDKPHGYGASGRVRPIYKRKRVLGLLTLVVLGLLWCTGMFARHQDKAVTKLNQWGWLKSDTGKAKSKADWLKRRERVVEAMELSWDAYERYAWGHDEFHPVSKTGRHMAPKGLGWIIIDSLDTLMLMNLTTRLTHAREWISKSLTWDQDQDVNTFETTIRMMGGLLSAHYLSTEFPDMAPISDDDPGTPGEDLYLEKAKDLADRLLAAFDSPSGVPYASVNLGQYKGLISHDDMGASSTAETTTLQLEFKYLAKLTGEKLFWDKAEKVMQLVDDNGAKDGLVPIYIYATTGQFRGDNIRLGSRGDSYYEYLIKQYLQTNKKETVYQDMWREALQGVRKHLVTYTEPSGFTIIGERPNGLKGDISPKMDHLVCFMPGTIALAATGGLAEKEARKLPTWTKQDDADMQLARELMQTCWGMYKWMATGLAAEITYFNVGQPHTPESGTHPTPPSEFDPDPKAQWRKDFNVHAADVHNLLRPETVESLFYMWRITGDTKYRDWGWEMFKSFMNYTAVEEGGGFTSLSNANVIPPVVRDNMESFWLAETLKYFYLLFSPDDLLPLDKIVFNTEAHPFPRFDMGPLFATGWKRKPRDKDGNIIVPQRPLPLGTRRPLSFREEEASCDEATNPAPSLRLATNTTNRQLNGPHRNRSAHPLPSPSLTPPKGRGKRSDNQPTKQRRLESLGITVLLDFKHTMPSDRDDVEMNRLSFKEARDSMAQEGSNWSTTRESAEHRTPRRQHRHRLSMGSWLDSFRRDPNRRITPKSVVPVVHDNRGSAAYSDYPGEGGVLEGHHHGGHYYDVYAANLSTANTMLARELKGRHLQMIAIGGSIGTGLFVASGKALNLGGPASLLIAYGFIGMMLYCTVQALGELAVAFPVAGSFSAFSTRFLDPAWGFAMGWNYALQWLIVLPLEIIAASITIGYWNNNLNRAIFVTIFLVTIITINLFGVKAYGEAEFVFAIVKVTAVIGFILLGIVINIGGFPNDGYIGGRYWSDPGAFHNGFKGLCSVFVMAAFAFSGTELVGLAAAETANPRKSLPSAIKQVFWRITLFYIVALTLVGLLVPYNHPELMGAATQKTVADASASPFVIAIQSAGIDVLPGVMNSVILVAVMSVGNSAVFGSSRTLAALADQRQAPRILGYVDRKGRPLVAVLVAGMVGFLAYLADLEIQSDVLAWLLAVSGLSSIFTWGSICLCHIRFRRAWHIKKHSVDELAFRSQAGVTGSWIGLACNVLVLIAQLWTAAWPICQASDGDDVARGFFLQYMAVPIVVVMYLAHKIWFRTRIVKAADIDVDTGRRDFNLPILVAQEMDEQLAWPRWKRVYRFFC